MQEERISLGKETELGLREDVQRNRSLERGSNHRWIWEFRRRSLRPHLGGLSPGQAAKATCNGCGLRVQYPTPGAGWQNCPNESQLTDKRGGEATSHTATGYNSILWSVTGHSLASPLGLPRRAVPGPPAKAALPAGWPRSPPTPPLRAGGEKAPPPRGQNSLAAVGFEPTPSKWLEPKSSALDHSATLPPRWSVARQASFSGAAPAPSPAVTHFCRY